MSWMWAAAAIAAKALAEGSGLNAQARANEAQATYLIDKANRDNAILAEQQEQANQAAREAKSDRMRQAEAELAKARSASAEGFGMLQREVAELGYLEGIDLSRIERNRMNTVKSIQNQREQNYIDAEFTKESTKRKHEAAAGAAFFNTVGFGIQIAGGMAASTPTNTTSGGTSGVGGIGPTGGTYRT